MVFYEIYRHDRILSFLAKVNHFLESVDAILEHKQLFDAKVLIERLSSFIVPNIMVDTCNHVKSCAKHGRPNQSERKLTVALTIN